MPKLQQVAGEAGIAAERALVMDICNEALANQVVEKVLAIPRLSISW